MKTVVRIMVFIWTFYAFAQIDYNDYVTGAITEGEKLVAEKLQKEAKKVSLEYAQATAVSALINAGRSRLNGVRIPSINIVTYNNVCNSYFFPQKKKRCKEKINFLFEAYGIVYELATTPTLFPVDTGVKEHISEKYVSISNRILKELETIKREAEKRSLLKKIINQ